MTDVATDFLLVFWGKDMELAAPLVEHLGGSAPIQNGLCMGSVASWFPDAITLELATRALRRDYPATLASSPYAGPDARTRAVASLEFRYKGQVYQYVYDFGYGYPSDSAKYMFKDGNYSCDCNRSCFIRESEPEFPELECGHEIEADVNVNRLP